MVWLTYSLLPLSLMGWLLMRWRQERRYRQQQEMMQARRRMALRRLSQWDGPSHRKR